jgi:hypothetical protein
MVAQALWLVTISATFGALSGTAHSKTFALPTSRVAFATSTNAALLNAVGHYRTVLSQGRVPQVTELTAAAAICLTPQNWIDTWNARYRTNLAELTTHIDGVNAIAGFDALHIDSPSGGWYLPLRVSPAAATDRRGNPRMPHPLTTLRTQHLALTHPHSPTNCVRRSSEVRMREAVIQRHMPRRRCGHTTSVTIGGERFYLTANGHADGTLGEVFIQWGKQGTTGAGLMDVYAVAARQRQGMDGRPGCPAAGPSAR